MKTIYILPLIFLVACSTVEPEDEPAYFPDFSTCNCGVEYEPICGSDGHNYLNECLLNCMKVDSMGHGNCSDVFFDPLDTLTWPIERVCIPIQTPQTSQFVRLLSDGSAIYQRPDGNYFRGNQNFCVCLSTNTLISTPKGQILVSKLSKGDLVWTMKNGEKIAAPINQTQQVKVDKDHIMLNIHLEDKRYLQISPLHPNREGIPLSNLSKGDSLDGSIITNLYYTHYKDSATWDLLPASHSGLYWANGILIGTTMKDWNGDLPF